MSQDLRKRLYDAYVSGGQSVAPETLEGLASRAPFLRHLVATTFPEDRDAKVMDLGCGHGALVHFAREAGYRDVRGIDVAAEQVEAARRLGIQGIEQGDLLTGLGELPAGSCDVVVAFDVMEHFGKDELLSLVDGVHRVLKPGGRWILHVPNGESPFVGSVLHGDLTHELAFTRDSLPQLLLASSYSEVRCFEDPPVAHGLVSSLRLIVWRLVSLVLRLVAAAETGSGRGAIFTRNLLAIAIK